MQLSKISTFYRQRMEKRPTDFGKTLDMILLKSLIQKLKAKPFNIFLITDVAI